MKVPWALVFVAKVLCFVAVIDVLVLPFLWVLKVHFAHGYILVTCYEGFCILVIGGLLLFNSLFSSYAQANDRYVGFGTVRRGLRFKKLSGEQKRGMRRRGILMVIIGLLLFMPTLVPTLDILNLLGRL